MKETSTSRAPVLMLWTCGASLRLTVWALPPVIATIQQDLHLSGTEVDARSESRWFCPHTGRCAA
jgi:hypothetical protein